MSEQHTPGKKQTIVKLDMAAKHGSLAPAVLMISRGNLMSGIKDFFGQVFMILLVIVSAFEKFCCRKGQSHEGDDSHMQRKSNRGKFGVEKTMLELHAVGKYPVEKGVSSIS